MCLRSRDTLNLTSRFVFHLFAFIGIDSFPLLSEFCDFVIYLIIYVIIYFEYLRVAFHVPRRRPLL